MYLVLEQALKRIFGTPELMMTSVSWHRDINSGYRKTVSSSEACSRDERLGDDGIRKGHLRQKMQPELFAILTIRYDDNQANRSAAWLRVNHLFRGDERVPKAIRKNSVLLCLYLMASFQLPELKKTRGKITITGKSRTTLFRWDKACETVANEWIRKAEDQASELLVMAQLVCYED